MDFLDFRVATFGDATLINGDCASVIRSLVSASVHMIFADGPYGNSNHAGDFNARLNDHRGIESKPILNDGRDAMRDIHDAMLSEAIRVMNPDSNAILCCCGGGGGDPPVFAWLSDRMNRDGLQFDQAVIWHKKQVGLGWKYRREYEFVFVAHTRRSNLRWPDKAARQRNIISVSAPRKRSHPNEKPLALVERFIQLHTAPGDVVLDPFMGSGTTGEAALKLGRKFIGVELDPQHFETACRRIEGEAAVLEFIR